MSKVFKNKFLGKIQKPEEDPLEKDIEGPVSRYAKNKGVISDKFKSENKRSVPDRIFTFKKGAIVFIEFKRLGKTPTEKQDDDHVARRENNSIVVVVDNKPLGFWTIDFFIWYDKLNGKLFNV